MENSVWSSNNLKLEANGWLVLVKGGTGLVVSCLVNLGVRISLEYEAAVGYCVIYSIY